MKVFYSKSPKFAYIFKINSACVGVFPLKIFNYKFFISNFFNI